MASPLSPSTNQASNSTLSSLRAEIQRRDALIQQLESRLARREAPARDTALESAEERCHLLESEVRTLRGQIETLQLELRDVSREKQRISAALESEAVTGVSKSRMHAIRKDAQFAMQAKDAADRERQALRQRVREWEELDNIAAEAFGTLWLRMRPVLDVARRAKIQAVVDEAAAASLDSVPILDRLPTLRPHVQAVIESYTAALDNARSADSRATAADDALTDRTIALELAERAAAAARHSATQLREKCLTLEAENARLAAAAAATAAAAAKDVKHAERRAAVAAAQARGAARGGRGPTSPVTSTPVASPVVRQQTVNTPVRMPRTGIAAPSPARIAGGSTMIPASTPRNTASAAKTPVTPRPISSMPINTVSSPLQTQMIDDDSYLLIDAEALGY